MKTIIYIIFFLIFCLTTEAQNFCKKTSVYFDLNKSDLTAKANAKIDSLLNSLNGNSYFIELYGYADSSATTEYNLNLSKKRILSVHTKIKSKTTIKFKYQEKNLGESKSTNDVSLDRRVDVFVFPENNGKIVLNSSNESVEIPIEYFGPCGICNSKPEIKAYYNDADAAKAKIKFKTSTGEDLITAGTLNFDFKPCNQAKSNPSDTISIIIKADSLDPEMTVWEPDTINGTIYWKASDIKPIFDTIKKRYVVRSVKRFINLDKPKLRKSVPNMYSVREIIVFPEKFTTIKSQITASHLDLSENKNDTVLIYRFDTISSAISIGKIDETYYILNKNLKSISSKVKVDTIKVDTINNSYKNMFVILKTYNVPFELFNELTYNDTTLKVRFKKTSKPEQFGFYLKEYNEFIPIKQDPNGKYFETKKPNANYVLAIVKKKKLYVIENKKVKSKYSKKKNLFSIKFNSSNISNFKQNRTYTVETK